jgi:hypothetical protein
LKMMKITMRNSHDLHPLIIINLSSKRVALTYQG